MPDLTREGLSPPPLSGQEEAGQACPLLAGLGTALTACSLCTAGDGEYLGLSIQPSSGELLPRPSLALPSPPSSSGSGLICPHLSE